MATMAEKPHSATDDTRFFRIMAWVMCTIITAGFVVNLAMGRSTFAVPWQFHVHGMVFFAWVGIYLAQNTFIAGGNIALHKRLGQIAYLWIPLMVVMGFTIMFVVMRRTGGPFFFDVNEFMISNTLQLLIFGGLGLAALRARRYSGWHRRLMFCAMAILTGPGLGRLLPMPLLIPHAWRIMVLVTILFPVIGMIADYRRSGKIHPAWFWGVGLILGGQIIADLIAYSPLGISLTEQVIAGTPGAERPMEAFLPPGFSM
ncbi:hypothetical protein P7228_03605 [Altererythrobacter arenosus]|uniref:Uncharacterized protein n=1 Tax=Altererythrobacter arenosus TaxID=3032592 RepID=A0ABY8FT29_9SPHN|nr:hypothetical protein [Altererythrobacter sp. CAU 1644]WFL78164.1 hypothetical protein P7228_03605 [Altererythrobacter sp. CAU 1644]